ncbi:MAG: putative quinol monooxygenase [Myxococcota bacterium]
MATILAHIQVHEGREPEFEELASDLHRATHAGERGVRHYEYWRSATPGLYYCLLAFDDFHAFLAHQTSDHHEDAAPKLGELIRDMQLEWVDPVQGASKLPPTEMQGLPEGADAPTARYHRLFAAKLQEWWRSLRS